MLSIPSAAHAARLVASHPPITHFTPITPAPSLLFTTGSSLELEEPSGLLSFIQTLDAPWVRIVLAQQNSLEYSYSKPEKLRPPGALPLTRCPVEDAAAFRTRELALRCETFANK